MLVFRLIKMNLLKALVDIFSENGKIHNFFEFTKDFHEMTRCNKTL